VASSGLSHFRGWRVQDSVLFWILAHREIWGWQEGSATLYVAAIKMQFDVTDVRKVSNCVGIVSDVVSKVSNCVKIVSDGVKKV
jgi:hypothetical protein